MERGRDFLQGQVNNAVMQHNTLLKALEDHADSAEDPRYRDLCTRFLPQMREHQRMLEAYADRIDAGSGAKKALGAFLGIARDLADKVRESDFLKLVATIVMVRQTQDTLRTFRDAGRVLNEPELVRLGEHGEREHQQFADAANRIVNQMFVEHVRDTAPGTVTDAEFTRATSTPGGTGARA